MLSISVSSQVTNVTRYFNKYSQDSWGFLYCILSGSLDHEVHIPHHKHHRAVKSVTTNCKAVNLTIHQLCMSENDAHTMQSDCIGKSSQSIYSARWWWWLMMMVMWVLKCLHCSLYWSVAVATQYFASRSSWSVF